MTSAIAPIAQESVHRICSGQVVLSLAIAVKELVENAVDAGATSVDVKLKGHGLDLIEVMDNGTGVDPSQYQVKNTSSLASPGTSPTLKLTLVEKQALTLKHHTSKLREFDDLMTVETFGFRGEALSSLCALADVSVLTCTENETVGTLLEYDKNGILTKKSPKARARGTTVILSELFGAWPVRLREMKKNIKREFAKMVHLLQGYCLVRPDVRFSCVNTVGKNRSTVLRTTGKQDVGSVISVLFGHKQTQSLMPYKNSIAVEEQTSGDDSKAAGVAITGYVSRATGDGGRGSSDRQFISINRRPCDHPKLVKAANETFRSYVKNRYPVLILDLTLPKTSVDINITPDKRSIFTLCESNLIELARNSLTDMWEPSRSTFSLGGCAAPSVSGFLQKQNLLDKSHNDDSALENESRDRSPNLNDVSVGEYDHAPENETGSSAVSNSNGKDFNKSRQSAALKTLNVNTENRRTDDSEEPTNSLSAGVLTKDTLEWCCQVRGCSKYKVNLGSEASLRSHYKSKHPRKTTPGATSVAEPVYQSSKRARAENTLVSDVLKEDDIDESEVVAPLYDDELTTPSTIVSSKKRRRFGEKSVCAPGCTCCPIDESGKMIDLQSSGRVAALSAAEKAPQLSEEALQNLQNCQLRPSSVKITFDANLLKTDSTIENRTDVHEVRPRFRSRIGETADVVAEEELARSINKTDFANMQILGQFNLGFIIAQLNNDLFIVDQHATDEKYNFERLSKYTVWKSQRFVIPKQLDLQGVHEEVVMDNIEIFRSNGFDFVFDLTKPPTQRVCLTQVPISKGIVFGTAEVEELIFLLSEAPGVMVRPSRLQTVLASRACRASIMIGTALTQRRMEELVQHMGTMEQPWNCPHGRPTMRHLFDLRNIPPDA